MMSDDMSESSMDTNKAMQKPECVLTSFICLAPTAFKVPVLNENLYYAEALLNLTMYL